MHLFTTVNEADLERIASSMSIDLYEFDSEPPVSRGKYADRNRYRFLLRPIGETYRLVREDPYTKNGYRRVWAVSWRGHRDFMRAVYALDPNATFRTAIDTWRDSDDFENRHAASGERNIGSMVAPQSYRDAELAPDAEFIAA
jgi:hypothetical protein